MKRSGRLSIALHVLMHMAERPDEPMTSERMAGWTDGNPVVIRRSFAGLREAGILSSSRGHGGGWVLARSLEEITLADVQQALDEPIVALAEPSDRPECLVEQAVNSELHDVFREAERLVLERMRRVTLADLKARFGGRTVHHPGDPA